MRSFLAADNCDQGQKQPMVTLPAVDVLNSASRLEHEETFFSKGVTVIKVNLYNLCYNGTNMYTASRIQMGFSSYWSEKKSLSLLC